MLVEHHPRSPHRIGVGSSRLSRSLRRCAGICLRTLGQCSKYTADPEPLKTARSIWRHRCGDGRVSDIMDASSDIDLFLEGWAVIFKTTGRENTADALKIAAAAAKERGIRYVVVASNGGSTALACAGEGHETICVTSACGGAIDGEMRAKLEAAGVKIVSAAHVLSGAERGISTVAKGMYPVEVMAHTLRMFGQGMKVCVEIAVMAADAGVIPLGEPVVAVGGTGGGADTAVVITPAPAAKILETKIHETLCKPSL